MKTIHLMRRALAALRGLVTRRGLVAQEFVKVEGKVADEVPAGPFVAIAYGFIWIAILSYVVYIARGVGRVRGELEEVRRKLDAAGKR
jgi:CcmD family protein